MSDTQIKLKFGDREIILVGTAHVSAESINEVTQTIEAEKPDAVAIELDEKRYANLMDPESWRKMDIIKVLKNKQGFLMMANIVLASYQKKMGLETGVKPGDEMLAAIHKAEEMGIPKYMVDREISVTLRRAWSENSLWGKCKLLAALIATAFDNEEVDASKIEELKNKSEMDSMMNSLAEEMPVIKEVLIDERNQYLAKKLSQFGWTGIRPAVGYPMWPEQQDIFRLAKVVPFDKVGISLTENGAMYPQASVAGAILK
mgnify:CR=1 FL=1